ncbi:MAG: hypothetical protein R3181_14520 [Rubricoccaceae bacterium]|nr:hypothetical protein [Rubricoccaceae bacterium]
MKETETKTDPRYEHVREAFARLETQDKAAFVLEATFDTMGQALRDVGQSVGDTLEMMGREDFFSDLFRRRAAEADTPNAAPKAGPKKKGSKKTPPKA